MSFRVSVDLRCRLLAKYAVISCSVHVPVSYTVTLFSLSHTHSFNGPLSPTTRVSWYQKGKTNLDVTEARDRGVSWAVCTSAPCSRRITMPAPHRSVFYRPDALPAPNQQRQSTEGSLFSVVWHFRVLSAVVLVELMREVVQAYSSTTSVACPAVFTAHWTREPHCFTVLSMAAKSHMATLVILHNSHLFIRSRSLCFRVSACL